MLVIRYALRKKTLEKSANAFDTLLAGMCSTPAEAKGEKKKKKAVKKMKNSKKKNDHKNEKLPDGWTEKMQDDLETDFSEMKDDLSKLTKRLMEKYGTDQEISELQGGISAGKWSTLHKMVAKGSLSTLNVIDKLGGNLDAQDEKGRSILHLLAKNGNFRMPI